MLEKREEACARLEERAQQRAAAERTDSEAKVKARREREGSAKGRKPKPPKETTIPDGQMNFTDANARLIL